MELGRKLTFYDQTFGCQMNFKDSEKLNGILEDIGYVKADTEKADFVYYNTCTCLLYTSWITATTATPVEVSTT